MLELIVPVKDRPPHGQSMRSILTADLFFPRALFPKFSRINARNLNCDV